MIKTVKIYAPYSHVQIGTKMVEISDAPVDIPEFASVFDQLMQQTWDFRDQLSLLDDGRYDFEK